MRPADRISERLVPMPNASELLKRASEATPERFPVGLPGNLMWEIPALAQKLYKMSPKEIVRALREQDEDVPAIEKRFSRAGVTEYEDILGNLWGNAPLRHAMLVRYVKSDADKKNKTIKPLDLAVLDDFLGGSKPDTLDIDRLRYHPEIRWWWAEVDDAVRPIPRPVKPYLAAVPRIFEGLKALPNMAKRDRDWHALVLLCASAILGSRLPLDAAVCEHELLREALDPLGWSATPTGESIKGYKPAKDCPLTIRRQYPLRRVWEIIDANVYYAHDIRRLTDEKTGPLLLLSLFRRWQDLKLHAIQEDEIGKELEPVVKATVDVAVETTRKLAQKLETVGVRMPYDPERFAREAWSQAFPINDLRYTDRLCESLNRLIAATTPYLRQNPNLDAILTHERDMKETVNADGPVDLEKISQLTARIGEHQRCLEGKLAGLHELAQVPKKPASIGRFNNATPSPVNNDPAPAEQVKTDEDFLAENIAQAAEINRLNEDLRQEKARRRRLEEQLQSNGKPSPTPIAAATRDVANIAVASGNITPEGILRMLGAVYGEDRLVILDTAFESARLSETFRSPRRLYELLTLLATEYRDMLASGHPDSEARHVLGNAYHANESETVTGTQRLARMRVFPYEGRGTPMYAHLSIGVGPDIASTIRAHFFWDGAKKRIVLGYCGPHLPTVKTP